MLTLEEAFWAIQSFAFAQGAFYVVQVSAYGRWLEKIMYEKTWGRIAKPLGACRPCFTGQVCLWSGLLLTHSPVKSLLFAAFGLFFNELRSEWQKTL